ncbi:hypothetical protein N7470_007902 [Penicillium chermesinum]|nr:hypothetical protein N7470_007902 [Penicillium chermesinum]
MPMAFTATKSVALQVKGFDGNGAQLQVTATGCITGFASVVLLIQEVSQKTGFQPAIFHVQEHKVFSRAFFPKFLKPFILIDTFRG